MKVLITSPSLDETDNVSGIASVLRGLMERSGARFVHFVAGRKDGENSNVGWFVRQLCLPLRFFRSIRREKPDVVHINTSLVPLAIFRDLALATAALMAQSRVLLHVHGGPFVAEGFGNFAASHAAKMLLRMADRIIVLSEVEKATLLKHLPSLDIRVLPNAIPIDEIPEFERNNKEKTIVFLGRLHESKGLGEIVKVCKELREQSIDFRFACFGTGPRQDAFTSEMASLLGNKFHFGGVVTGAEKLQALGNADIFLLPSKYEGLPIALLEAMAAGCVPVISATGSVPTVVEDGANGFLIAPDNISDIVEKIKHLLADESELNRLGQNARSTIRDRFNIRHYVEKLNEIYADILK